MRSIVLLSGGIDSTVALAWALSEGPATALSVDYGAHANREEIRAASRVAHRLGAEHLVTECYFIADHFRSALLPGGDPIPEGPGGEPEQAVTIVPFRNGILLSLAVGLAASRGAERVVIGCQGGDFAVYPDCRPGFLALFGRAAQAGTGYTLDLAAPFLGMTKAQVVALGRELDAPLSLTYSCYLGAPAPCGRCAPCRDREAVL